MSHCTDCGTTDEIHHHNCATHERDWPENRMDAVGQNGGDGLHYAKAPCGSDITACLLNPCGLCPGYEYAEDSDSGSALSYALRADPHEALTSGPTQGRAEGLKFDADKPRMELLIQGMPRALEAIGQVLTFGAQKYEAHSWQLVEDNHNRYWAAKVRHDLARAKGETHDEESGLLHLAHEACCVLFLLELALMERGQ